MKKITKRQALSLFRKNIPFTICASKIHPQSDFAMQVDPKHVKDETVLFPGCQRLYSETDDTVEAFERYLASFYSYNCTEETGLRIAYYV